MGESLMTDILYKDLSYKIMNAVFKVHNTLGMGFLEKVYENALMIELKNRNLKCVQQCPVEVFYNGHLVGDYIADILVENKIILELKAVHALTEIHDAQVLNYLKR
jgi:GxxExxY protein